MSLSITDWVVIALYILIVLFAGFKFRKTASKSINEFFLSGRNLPWYLAGFSMVAATFTINSPVTITEFVHNEEIFEIVKELGSDYIQGYYIGEPKENVQSDKEQL